MASKVRTVVSAARKFCSHSHKQGPELKGVFIPLVTNFNEKGEICYDSIKKNLQFYETTAVAGYVVAGSNGESPYLTPTEKVDLVKFVRENTSNKKPVIGGSTAESTSVCCELSKELKTAGADALLIMPPFYFRRRMTDEAIKTHYFTIADNVDLPIVIYNMPVVSGIDISTETLAQLAKHPNIRAVKDSDVRKCANTVLLTKNDNFDVLVGSAGYLLPALVNGCSGGINGLAGAFPRELSTIYKLYQEEKYKEAMEIQRKICPSDTMLLAEMGVPGLKYAMELLGLQGGHCRKPILPISDSNKTTIKECLTKSGLLKI